MNERRHSFVALSVMFHDSLKGISGSVSLKLPIGEQLNIETNPLSSSIRRIVFSRDDCWWLVLSDVRSLRARLPSEQVVTEADHAPFCDSIDGQSCLRLDAFVAGKVRFDAFTLLYKFVESPLTVHPCVVLPIPRTEESDT